MRSVPRLMMRCSYGMATAAWVDEKGIRHLDISHPELDRYSKILKKQLKKEPTMLELFEHVKEAITQ